MTLTSIKFRADDEMYRLELQKSGSSRYPYKLVLKQKTFVFWMKNADKLVDLDGNTMRRDMRTMIDNEITEDEEVIGEFEKAFQTMEQEFDIERVE